MSERVIYIEITIPVTIDEHLYLPSAQLIYSYSEWRDTVHLVYSTRMMHHIGLDCDDNEIAIPADSCVLTPICKEFASFREHIVDRDMDKTIDYRDMVKKALNIDLHDNNKMQVNPIYYEKICLRVPKKEEDNNEYYNTSNDISAEKD